MSYWGSDEGARHRRRARQHSTLFASVEQEPMRKGRRVAASAVEFRRAMQAQISIWPGWPKPRARLAMDLTFSTTRREPPTLYNLAKHYLDQLGQTHDEGEGGFLYRDDRQIQLLHVAAHHAWEPDVPSLQPSISLNARTATNATADMREAARLDIDDHSFEDVSEDFRDELDAAARVALSKNAELRRAAPLMRALALSKAQERHLHDSDRWMQQAFWGSARFLLSGKLDAATIDDRAFPERLHMIERDAHLVSRSFLLGQHGGRG